MLQNPQNSPAPAPSRLRFLRAGVFAVTVLTFTAVGTQYIGSFDGLRGQTTPSSGLIAHWKFDEGSGTVAHNSIPGGPSGELMNMEPEDWEMPDSLSGLGGSVLSPDDNYEYVEIPGFTTSGSGPFSIAFWVGSETSKWKHYVMVNTVTNTGSISLAFNPPQLASTLLSAEGNWSIMYINGELQPNITPANATMNINGLKIFNSTNPWYIGKLAPNTWIWMDDLRVYNRVLTSQEAADLYVDPSWLATYGSSSSSSPANTNPVPLGAIDALSGPINSVNCDSDRITGWTCDTDERQTPLRVDMYINKDAYQGGTLMATTTANIPREAAVATTCGYSARGFSFGIPASLKDGILHKLYLHPINLPAGPNPSLGANPSVSIHCAPPANSSSSSALSTTNAIPIGGINSTDCGIVGWACDPDQPNTPINVQFKRSDGISVGTILANGVREAAVGTACGGNSAHGFIFPLPNLTSNLPLNIYALDVPSGSNQFLAQKTVTACPQPPMTVTIAGPASVTPGQTVSYTVTVKNNGNTQANGVVARYDFSGLTFIPEGSSKKCLANDHMAACGPSTYAPGQQRTFTLQIAVPATKRCNTFLNHMIIVSGPTISSSGVSNVLVTTISCASSSSVATSSAASSTTAIAAPGPTQGLIGHWKFDETSGAVARDSGPNGLHGTYVNMAPNITTGLPLVSGNIAAPSFAGNENEYVDIASIPMPAGNIYSIAEWYKLPGQSEWTHVVMATKTSTTTNNPYPKNWDWTLLYRNGAAQPGTTGILPSGGLWTTAGIIPAAISGRWQISLGEHPGQIDDFRIYNRLLTAKEAGQLFAAGPLVPIGDIDNADCKAITGWTCDINEPDTALKVDMYSNNDAYQGGTLVATTTANIQHDSYVDTNTGRVEIESEDAAACGNSTHGFSIEVPASVKDGLPHKLYIHPINVPSGPNPSFYPVTIQCATPLSSSSSSSTATIGIPIGAIDSTDCGIVGWACDPDQPNTPINVEIYRNAPKDAGGDLERTVLANIPREAAVGTACGGNSTHGFYLPLSGLAWPLKMYIYPINAPSGSSPLLAQKSIKACPVSRMTQFIDGPASVAPGQTVSFTAHTGNYGNTRTVGGATYAIPQVMTFSRQGSSWDCSQAKQSFSPLIPSYVACGPLNYYAGQSRTFTLRMKVSSTAMCNNIYQWIGNRSETGYSYNSNITITCPASSSVASSSSSSSPTSSPTLTQTTLRPIVYIGETQTHTFTYQNGPTSLANAHVNITMDYGNDYPGWEFVSASTGCVQGSTNMSNTVTCTLGTLAPNTTGSVTITVRATNRACLSHLQPIPTGFGFTKASLWSTTLGTSSKVDAPTNIRCASSSSANPSPTLTQTTLRPVVYRGETQTYTFTYQSDPTALADATVHITMDYGWEFVSGSTGCVWGGANATNHVSCTLGALAPNTTGSVTVTLRATNNACLGSGPITTGNLFTRAKLYSTTLGTNNIISVSNTVDAPTNISCRSPVSSSSVSSSQSSSVSSSSSGNSSVPASSPQSSPVSSSTSSSSYSSPIASSASTQTCSTQPVAGPSGLVGYWKFDEASGTQTLDSSTNARHGTFVHMLEGDRIRSNLPPVPGGNCGAIALNGVSNYVDIPGLQWPAGTNPITVSFWNHVTTANLTTAGTFGNANMNDRFSAHAPWGSDKLLYWDYGGAGDAGRITVNYTNYLNKWTHVTLVSEGNGGGGKAIYLDGRLVAAKNGPSDGPDSTTPGFRIGQAFGSYYHRGMMDDFRLYNRVLSAAEVQQIAGTTTVVSSSSSSSFVSSSLPSSSPAVCTDTDGGQNALVQGYATNQNTTVTDVCYNSQTLTEAICQNGQARVVYIGCSNGCVGGRCNSPSSSSSSSSSSRSPSSSSSAGFTSSAIASSNISSVSSPPISSVSSSAQSSVSLAAGLVGYWKFDEANGTTALDSSTNAKHGTLMNTVAADRITTGLPSVLGGNLGALALRGSQYVNIPGFQWPSGNAVTVAFWRKVATNEKSGGGFGPGTFSVTDNMTNRFGGHAPFSDEKIYWDYGDAGGPGRLTANYAAHMNKWTHVTLVSAGNGGSFKAIYLDGQLASSSLQSDGPDSAFNGLTIGRGYGSWYDKGAIDDFRIYNRVLSASEIQSLAGGTFASVNSSTCRYFCALRASLMNWNWGAFVGKLLR